MRAGARIFYDTPAQYGLGPTSLIAAACRSECWTGMYYIVGGSNLVYGIVVAATCLRLTKAYENRALTFLVLVASFAACFLYPAYPPSISLPSISPSTGGLRFLPCAVLVCYLVWLSERPWSYRVVACGHVLWAIGILWSPESAFHVTFTWWSYYLWRSSLGRRVKAGMAIRHFVGSVSVLGAILVGFSAVCLGLYYQSYRVLPSVDGLFGYVLYPPGPIPFDFSGVFLFFALSLGLGLQTFHLGVRREASPVNQGKLLAVLLGLYSVASYYLGRSIDNNLLNLMPFLLMVLLAVFSISPLAEARAMSASMISMILVLPVAFGWQPYWGKALEQSALSRIDSSDITKVFSFSNPTTDRLLDEREHPRNPRVQSSDVRSALEFIDSRYHEPFILAAPPLVLPFGRVEPWTALHVPANFSYLPTKSVLRFLERTKKRFGRTGWVIIQDNSEDSVAIEGRRLVLNLDVSYERDVTLKFGAYSAIRFIPRQ